MTVTRRGLLETSLAISGAAMPFVARAQVIGSADQKQQGAPNSVVRSTVRTVEPSGEITWHVEQAGSGPDVVLVPSGEGDCGSFGKVIDNLARDFRVTTFDTPGFSRSKVSDGVEVSMTALGRQVASLIEKLGLGKATIYGCSSAGLALLDLVSNHEQLVRRAVVHEAALPELSGKDSPLGYLAALDDAGIVAACTDLFANFINEDKAAWMALGEEYHKRLAANYVTWVRRYLVGPQHGAVDPKSLAGRPIKWTIGELFEVKMFFSNVRLAHQAGIDLGTLPCKHFPQVSIPGVLAEHIRAAALSS
ncbi:alpha/beta fold hydrolase [Bradyrhizobium elkanii]|uniref:alpha/beta fold hydrolase n=1 Tax=Bradyrhizobium elkanii TaxID=29448 RepID=UPI003510F9D7